jgi:23S rRNA pseudouridine1911/1915/1917 synthase
MTIEAKFLTVGPETAGARLDTYLASTLQGISRTRIQRSIEDGDVLINDRPAKVSYRLRPGDRVDIDLPEPPPTSLVPAPVPFNVVFEDDDLIVVEKPAGIIVHPGSGIQAATLASGLAYHFNELSAKAGQIRPGIVHRIDKDTSGLLIVAKNDVAHENLSNQFRDREVFKQYVALTYGRMSEVRGEINARLGRSVHNRTKMAVLRGGAGRAALTLFEAIRNYQEFTLLQVQIKTGRTHQIRVHMAHVGHPVVGDFTYGAGRENTVRSQDARREIASLNRHFLHSARLAFKHPRTGEVMEFASDLPAELAAFLSHLE